MLMPPSKEEIKNRLIKRNTESEEKINLRMQRIDYELEKASLYDYTVVNDELEKAICEIQDIIKKLEDRGVRVVIYEPALLSPDFGGTEVLTDIDEFKEISSVILANRMEDGLKDVANKVYTRDLFSRD